jgi:hypothetical protein
MRYRLLIEYPDGTFKVLEDSRDNLLDYSPKELEVCTLTRYIWYTK